MRKLIISMPMYDRTEEDIRKEWLEWKEAFEEYNRTHPDIDPFEVIDTIFDSPDISYKYVNLYYLAKTIETMAREVDVVFFAPNWMNYRGCEMEYHICEEYGIRTITYEMLHNPLVKFPIPERYSGEIQEPGPEIELDPADPSDPGPSVIVEGGPEE